MKRKIIKQGNGTLTLTLPKEWTKKIGLSGKEEIEVVEQGKELLLSPLTHFEEKKIKVDVSKLNPTLVSWYIYSIYTRGYEEIELYFDNPKIGLKVEESLSKDYLGFEVIEHKKNRCLIKRLSSDLDEEFDKTLKRVFMIISYMGNSIIEYYNKGKIENIEELLHLETNTNRLTNFCERVLNKTGYKERYKTNVIYLVTWQLEIIADCFRDIVKKLKIIKKIDRDTINQVRITVEIFDLYLQTFYKFDKKKLDNILDKIKFAKSNFEKNIKKNPEPYIIIKSNYIIEKISEVISQIFMINLEY